MPHYDLKLTKKHYSAQAVQQIAQAACTWGYSKGIDDSKAVAKQQVNEAMSKVRWEERESRRMNLANNFIQAMRFIIDP